MPRPAKKNDQEEPDEGPSGACAPGTRTEKPEDKLDELAGLVKSLMQAQVERDQQREKESSRQEQRWRRMQHQVSQIQQQVGMMTDEQRTELDTMEESYHPQRRDDGRDDNDGDFDDPDEMMSQASGGYRPQRDPKLLPLSPDDDIEHFLTTFERMARVCHWPKDGWAVRLVPLLTGKARSAYVLMDVKDSEKYDKVRAAILAKYEITPDTYRRRFRSLKIEPGETPQELYVRLKDLFCKWVKPEKATVKELSETIILEQFLRMVHPELEIWIREHDPGTAEEAARLAEVFTSARRGSRAATFGWENRQAQSNLSTLQKQDGTLKQWFEKVTEVEGVQQNNPSCLDDATYIVENGLLYQRNGKTKTLALPQQFRQRVMEMGHSIPWAGHMAFQKTLNRIGSRFAWPGMYTQVSQFCASCEVCQLTSAKGVTRAHLQSLPIIDTPFERIGMDIVGPLEKSSSGHRYILVLCDYATRYPEAFPLRSFKARQVADCLLHLFSRVGIPKEILTDCGTNFLSKLLQQVYQVLGVKGIKTTPYHPQTDGLVERYNRTLKSMLRKFVSHTGADWDRWLPYLLFAYREVPQASTGFSPFELLYGRQVRGPLDLLRDYWESSKPEGENVVAYVVKMRERLEEMTALAHEHMASAQQNQKAWYDRKARERVFEPGQKVLLLLPTSESKLLTKWHGPYEVSKRVGKVTYELFMPDKVKKYQTFHVNLLKEFQVCPEPVHQQLLVRAVQEEDTVAKFFPVTTTAAEGPEVDLSHLSLTQQAEVKPLLDPELFRETPGFTSLVQHKIRLKGDAPVRQKSYRIPERLIPLLQKEIKLMMELGIIEVSCSEWCSPIVLVPKKDGSLRFCIDFRYLNAVSNFDPYPMPRIDDLVERVGRAQYITTLDLSKGYWQVALAPEAREMTAFRTPFGMYQFKVMPFGLQGAPATFQRLMDHVLRDLSDFAAAYLDDVVIFSQSWEMHKVHLQQVLQKLQAAGLTINPHKCAVAQREVEYLGYIIGFGQIKPQLGKVEAIKSFPVPTTKRKLRGFLGLVGWYRKFVPHFADRAVVLNDLTKASAPSRVHWTDKCDRAFRDLKEAICTYPVLQSPDFEKPFILQTDASGVGLGAVLLQEVEGERRPVVFLSRKLLDRETRYSTVEKECLAMKWAIDTLRYYLLGRHFFLETDHRALQWLHRMRDANMRIAGWYLALQPYDFTVNYRSGKSNVVADCLSRMSED
ncbi:Retrovirus-related Pol polyprotein from transposon 17.6 [Collichthys lucidus]|uniref:Gypsy retrotransposon integrase-like protein 1 n=1 Tax=Collichthys lucidus TaxID=240159 RepID=A0A4U5TVV9_COLLU|nr:Retrovirus-related Pol polyprotein from transposon 17.6 [Collichthys lucidus]